MKTHDDQKHKPGRPNADAAKLRKHILPVRLSDADLLELDRKSKATKLPYSAFLREAGLGRELPRPVPKINLDIHQELGRIGRNLNQLLKCIHEGAIQFLGSTDAETVHELAAIIPIVRKEVRGK